MNQKKHVAGIPFPFGSHPRPLFNLLLKLATSNPSVLFSFFTLPNSDHSSLLSSSSSTPNIKFFDVEDGVTAGHQFSGNPVELVDLFLHSAPRNLTTAIEAAVGETGFGISCLVSDAFLIFAGEIAEKFEASWVAVWMASPTSLSAHFYTRIIREKSASGRDQELDFVPGLSMLRVKDLPAEILFEEPEKESVFSRTLSQMGEKLPKADAVAVNCFQELVPEALNNDLKSKFMNYLNLGFLSMSLSLGTEADQTGCLHWLDTQSPESVAYISFGTVAALPEKELTALADALESSRIPFLWSLKGNLKSKLPYGFIERTEGQGKIVPWAPQNSVLAHDSVAVFVNHGGYNSVCESIVYGVPMICRPVFADHMVMARIVEAEWGVGVTVEDGVVTKNGLLKDLEMFFASSDERGKKMRENVEELKKVVLMAALPNGAAARDLNKLVDIVCEV